MIQTRYYEGSNVTVVVRTEYSYTKGELVWAILFPKPIDFKFYRDSVKFIGFLTLIASFGMIYALVIFILRKAQASFVIKCVLDIVTIVVPPSLPAVMTVGSVYVQSRLKAKDIFCISPNRINVAGKLKLFCFDKTGTLTENGLDMWGVVPAINGSFNALVMNPSTLPFESSLLAALATCHSLTVIESQLTGDPLDLKTFESTNWVLLEPQCQYNVHVPTIVRLPGVDVQAGTAITLGEDHMNLFAKGAPEKITSLCVPSSLPENFNDLLHGYTVQGLVIMQNAFKRETTPVIDVLNAAKIRTVMVTGDNMHTAISVARNCRPLTVPLGSESVGFVSTSKNLDRDWPDVQLLFVSTVNPLGNGLISCIPFLLRPKSTGCIRLQSADGLASPLINMQYLSNEDDASRLLEDCK
ncbi:hypothetical protein CHUAL_006900 [Chamberlinius hualienensis]